MVSLSTMSFELSYKEGLLKAHSQKILKNIGNTIKDQQNLVLESRSLSYKEKVELSYREGHLKAHSSKILKNICICTINDQLNLVLEFW